MSGPARRRARVLAPAMLAVIRERGPIDHIAALHQLKREGRVARGVTLAAARAACSILEAEGAIERDGTWDWRVPSDSAVIIPEREHDDGAPASTSGIAA